MSEHYGPLTGVPGHLEPASGDGELLADVDVETATKYGIRRAS